MQIGKDTAAFVAGGASAFGETTARRSAKPGVKVAAFDVNARRGAKLAAGIGGRFRLVDIAGEASVDAGLMTGLRHTPLSDTVSPEFRQSFEAQVPFPSGLGKPDEYDKMVDPIIDNDMLNGFAIRLDGAIRGPEATA